MERSSAPTGTKNTDTSNHFDGYLEKFLSNCDARAPQCVYEADALMAGLVESFNNEPHIVSARLFHLAYGSLKVSVALTLAGATPQVPILLRHALECGVYGYLFSRSPEYEELWNSRETDVKAKKKMRSGRTGPMKMATSILEAEDPVLCERIREALDFSIDQGAHPNIFQLLGATREEESGDGQFTFYTKLLGGQSEREISFTHYCGVAVELVNIFELIWPELFKRTLGEAKRRSVIGQWGLYQNSTLKQP